MKDLGHEAELGKKGGDVGGKKGRLLELRDCLSKELPRSAQLVQRLRSGRRNEAVVVGPLIMVAIYGKAHPKK